MHLRFSPFRATGLVAVTTGGQDGTLPSCVRVVDAATGVEARRLALDPALLDRLLDTDSPPARPRAGLDPPERDAAQLDALIALAESGVEGGHHECGGA